jgi:hypothetical protein
MGEPSPDDYTINNGSISGSAPTIVNNRTFIGDDAASGSTGVRGKSRHSNASAK